MTTHTPGPWWFSAAEEGYYVAGVGDKELTNLIQKEDARLIAAAPELLEALYRALPFVEDAKTDPAYKTGYAARIERVIKELIERVEQ